MRPRWALRALAVLATTVTALLVAGAVLPGLSIRDWRAAAVGAAVLGVLNAVLWPVLVRLALPLTVITLGVFPLLLNGALVTVAASAVPGIEVAGLGTGVATTVVISAVAAAMTGLLSLEDDDVWARGVLRRAHRAERNEVPGVLFVQIDGLGHDVLRRALRDGNAPTMARWLRTGSHRLESWQTDWSSQTGASQAGILLGSNENMPAFRWLEKDTGLVMVSNHPSNAAELERRHSSGRGLLHDDGVSRGNIFTGDATASVLTMSVAGQRKGRVGAGYYAYFSRPYNTARTLVATVAEIVRELLQARSQRQRDVLPRVGRGGVYPVLRAFTTVITRDVLTSTLVGDVLAGRSVIYADYVGYDEVAHHSGVERHDALETLRRLDRELARLERAVAEAPRPYRLVVLSDHGQSQGATFRQRYGETLAEVVAHTVGVVDQPQPETTGEESWGYAGGALEEVAAGTGAGARLVRRATRGQTVADDVVLGPERAALAPRTSPVVVLASGNLALVSLRDEPGRVSRERLQERFPALLTTLVAHPGVGFVLVDSQTAGPVVLGARGSHELRTGTVTGEDPLTPFGEHASTQVARTSTFEHCADVMVNSIWDEQTDEVAAFEELVGSHGGLGGAQSHPFVLRPVDLPWPDDEVLGAERLHRVLRGWLGLLGHPGHQEQAG